MSIRVTGTIVRGEGNASGNHAVLIPLLASDLPEIANCDRYGTINVQLDQSLDKSRADYWTQRLKWDPVQMRRIEKEGRVEAFGFIRTKFECPLGGPTYGAWILLPEGSGLTYRKNYAEVIADVRVQGVEYGVRCAIQMDRVPAIAAPPWFGAIYGMTLPAR